MAVTSAAATHTDKENDHGEEQQEPASEVSTPVERKLYTAARAPAHGQGVLPSLWCTGGKREINGRCQCPPGRVDVGGVCLRSSGGGTDPVY